jgi:transcriptional regulator with XRE-family HTH domain
VNDLKTAFGKTLKALRTEKDLTQQQLADFAGLDRAYISELERGQLMPSLETVFRLAQVLKIRASKVVQMVENETPA